MPTNPRAVIYTRVSRDSQIDNTSLIEQDAACRAKAKAMGARVVASYEDPIVKGTSNETKRGQHDGQ